MSRSDKHTEVSFFWFWADFMKVSCSAKVFFYDVWGAGGEGEGVGGVKASGAPNGRDSTYRDVEGKAKAVP